MQQHSREFSTLAKAAIANTERARNRDSLGVSMPAQREQAISDFGGHGDFSALRSEVKNIRQHALDHLGHYLESFTHNARDNGSSVHFARNSDELNEIVLDICNRVDAQGIAKGKSMITEETGLNAALEAAGFSVRETDLGEYIIQEAGETPSHIVAPALHKSKKEIRNLFLNRHPLGERDLSDADAMVAEARAVLRKDFLTADVGIIGSNALIAETGHSMLVTNEGNGDLCANLPRTLIICTSVDRVLPRTDDAMAMLRVLVRSTTGQAVSCYTSFYAAPRKAGDLDGPLEIHFVLLDNQRSDILASDYADMLHCIRCGACLNHCPIYTSAGGHAYGWVYPGPMGSVLTPLLTSLEDSAPLPDACTSCGRCEEVCPALIPLPDMLRDLRSEKFVQGVTSRGWRIGLKIHSWLALHPRIYQTLTGLAVQVMHTLGRRKGVIKKLPFAQGWLVARDLPAPAAKTFQQMLREGLLE